MSLPLPPTLPPRERRSAYTFAMLILAATLLLAEPVHHGSDESDLPWSAGEVVQGVAVVAVAAAATAAGPAIALTHGYSAGRVAVDMAAAGAGGLALTLALPLFDYVWQHDRHAHLDYWLRLDNFIEEHDGPVLFAGLVLAGVAGLAAGEVGGGHGAHGLALGAAALGPFVGSVVTSLDILWLERLGHDSELGWAHNADGGEVFPVNLPDRRKAKLRTVLYIALPIVLAGGVAGFYAFASAR